MLATTMATWMLVVQLTNPLQPDESLFWNRRYSTASAEQCEDFARTTWVKYHMYYKGTFSPWAQTFSTTCHASTAHHHYMWTIKCDANDNCETKKLKELKR